ncbi:hypothetical protein [Acidocella aminolytica]|uniref:Uncharacterized protein n=1 Tax=Acidocella aminolytica 101 = DSM 11237 TaxID=1120923 RepID=A0A0D6PH15_9PROT|nr:hypothetical protein [Acidocella aminolytica]GAN80962.1 hypothetical protein Aam_066_026 [Acidocella aminolytica 101 = DSM 11237]GBQ37154.1 hypothetical protein AA11237_1447 [Acidocella aminolytica 101 = DSM 11237]SHF31285.1 hypothetical protein SAMN02746095_02811 [Acidocella aminolytica 101 = DSM 11237]
MNNQITTSVLAPEHAHRMLIGIGASIIALSVSIFFAPPAFAQTQTQTTNQERTQMQGGQQNQLQNQERLKNQSQSGPQDGYGSQNQMKNQYQQQNQIQTEQKTQNRLNTPGMNQHYGSMGSGGGGGRH